MEHGNRPLDVDELRPRMGGARGGSPGLPGYGARRRTWASNRRFGRADGGKVECPPFCPPFLPRNEGVLVVRLHDSLACMIPALSG